MARVCYIFRMLNQIHVVRPGEVILSWCDDENDPQYEISQEAFKALSEATDARGRQLKIHKMQIPGPLHIREDEAGGIVHWVKLAFHVFECADYICTGSHLADRTGLLLISGYR